MKNLELELQDMVLIGRHGDFGKAVDPLEDKLEKVMFGIEYGGDEQISVDLDGDLEIIEISQLPDDVSEQEVKDFLEKNIQEVVQAVRSEIASRIDQ